MVIVKQGMLDLPGHDINNDVTQQLETKCF